MAEGGNGIDLGAVYQLLTEVAETVRAHGERFDRLERRMDQALSAVNREIREFKGNVSDLNTGVSELRKDVTLYHEAVTGQGIHYSELEGRVQRVERHLRLEPSGE